MPQKLPVRAIATYMMLLLMLLPAYAEADMHKEDSLLAVLSKLQVDSERVLTYNELFKVNYFSDPDRALSYAQTGLTLARKTNFLNGIGRLTNNIGVWHSKRGNYQEALDSYAENLTVWEKLGKVEELADCQMNIGSVWYKQGRYEEALENYAQALQDYRNRNDTIHSLDAINNIGSVYMNQGRYVDALEAFMGALRLRETLGDPQQISISCANIGSIYQLEGRLDEAMRFFKRSLRLSLKSGDKFGEAAALCNIGEVELERENWEAAAARFRDALVLSERINDHYAKSTALLGMARYFEAESLSDSANVAYSEALRISREIGRQHGVAVSLSRIGFAKLERKDFNGAEVALLESLEISNSIESRDLSCENYRMLGDVYLGKGNHKSAYKYQQRYVELHDSIFSSEKGKQIAEMQEIYEAQQNQAEIQRLTLQNAKDQLSIARSSGWLLALGLILVPVLLLALIFYMRFRQKKRLNTEIEKKNREIKKQRDLLEAQNNQIREINVSLEKMITVRTKAVSDAHAELDTFLYQSAHALRRPLLRVDGLVNLIENESADDTRSVYRSKLTTTLSDMDQLLHKLIAVTESSHRELNLVEIPLLEMLEEIVRENQNGSSFRHNIPIGLLVVSDEYLLRKLLSSVVENSFQSQTDPDDTSRLVKVDVEKDEAFVTISISDHGHGIASEQLEHVFEMFYRGTNRSGGHGLGLYVAQKVCHKLHGTIEIESEVGKGTTVQVMLPRHTI